MGGFMISKLNSIIVEGTLKDAPALIVGVDRRKPLIEFFVVSKRWHKNLETFTIEETTVKVQTFGELAERLLKDAKKDRGLRVVGRIANDETGQVIIIAEHCELKPEPRKP
jgi:single-stranded DNA-binding protein